jgi:hypothetical protein
MERILLFVLQIMFPLNAEGNKFKFVFFLFSNQDQTLVFVRELILNLQVLVFHSLFCLL